MRRALLLIALTAWLIGPTAAFEFEPVKPMDVKAANPALLADVYGTWEIRDESGTKRCRINLLKDFGIGGYQIEVAPGCAKAFPVMGDISAWRLLQGGSIDLVDPLRKTRVRFETPDNRYVPFSDEKDIAGIHEFVKIKDKAAPGKK